MPIGPKFSLPKLKTGGGVVEALLSVPSAEQNQKKIKAKALTKLTPFRALISTECLFKQRSSDD